MKTLSVLFLFATLLSQTACSVLEVQRGIPSMTKIDAWIADDQYGRALTSLEHIPAETPHFTAYLSKRKEVELLAKKYEQQILKDIERITDDKDSASKLSLLDKALEKYPGSDILRERHKVLLKQHLRRVRRLDAEALLVRAQQLYNKLPLHEQDVRESPIDFSAHFTLQNMRGEIADMHNRLMAIAGLLLDDNELAVANRCLSQARKFPADLASLDKLKALQKQIDGRLKYISEKAIKNQKRISDIKIRQQMEKKKRLSKKLQHDIDEAINKHQLVMAGKLLSRLGNLAPDNPNYLKLKLQHREKVSEIVKRNITRGNRLYQQEKIYQAKKVWEEALKLDPKNKTLQTSILRAKHVLDKLRNLRQQQSASAN
jgi:tetratricopeptide (TPR) repeat protein